MKPMRPRRIALVGFAIAILGFLWSAAPNYLASLNDPPGWIFDRPLYQPAVVPILIGVSLLVGSAVVVIVGFAKRKFSK
ncbi:MAG: hypothetical protein LAP61_04370 [Acidobacteriia bacterium]|nr:hypothetical protein [Terriglobia bacterium]